MALKHVITKKEEFDALAEPVRALYTEKPPGTWILEGLVPESELTDLRSKVGEFRDNNIRLTKDMEKLSADVAKFKGVDVDEYTRLKARAKELEDKGIKGGDDLQKAIDAALKPHLDRLDASEKAREAAQRQADGARFRELVTADATKIGVKPNMMRVVIRDAEETFELKEGKLAPRAGVKHPTDPLKDMTLDVWLQNLDKDLLAESVGGGANNGGRTGGRPSNVKVLVNPTNEEKGRHLDQIAKGEVVVEYR